MIIMQAFKIENYEKDSGVGTFVPFRHLSSAESISLIAGLRGSLELPEDISPKDMVLEIHDRSFPVSGVNAVEEKFDLSALLNQLGFDLSELMYLNWYHYDDVDEMRTRDVLMKFSDIWYPSSDDLDLVDAKMRWLVSIHHSGAVRALKLPSGSEMGDSGNEPTSQPIDRANPFEK